MPKQNHIVRNFVGGLVLDIAREDLPQGFLVNNTRNVHTNRSGHLIGFRDRKAYLDDHAIIQPIHAGKHSTKDGLRNFHIEDHITPRIRSYKQGETTTDTKNFPDGVKLNPEKVSHAQRLGHLYIGTGNGSDNTPLWYGKHSHMQFGQAPPADFELLPGKLASPTQLSQSNSFPRANGSVIKGLFTYMISPDTPYVYKFSGQNLVKRSPGTFNGLSAICADSEDDHIWVYERQSNSVNRLNADLDVVSSLSIDEFPSDGMAVQDIALVGGNIYITRGFDTPEYTEMENWLYRVPRNTGTISVSATDISRTGFSQGVFFPYAATEPEVTGYSLRGARMRLPKSSLIVDGFQAYVVFNIDTSWELQYTFPSGDTDTVTIQKYDLLTLESEALPAAPENTGFLIVMKLDDIESPGLADKNNLNLIVENRPYQNIDEVGHDDTDVHLWKMNHEGAVYRLHYPWNYFGGSYVGNAHILVTSNMVDFSGVLPVIAYGSTPQAWFSRNNPPQTGTIDQLIVSNATQSQSSINADPIPGGFAQEDRIYHYAFSFIYDGYMESPLSDSVSAIGKKGYGFSLEIKIPVDNITRRVTGMNVYRAEGSISGREEFYRLVDFISFELALPTEVIDDQQVYIISYNDRKKLFELGVAFTSNSGIPETMKEVLPHYGLSVAHEDMLFIADCWHPLIDNAELMLFRSHPYAFNSFNVENDVLRLEAKPTAMASFSNRVCVADQDQMVVVDPANLIIENRYKGMGAMNSQCMKATEYGLVVAGTDHIRLFDGQGIQSITDRITIHSGANLSPYSNNPNADDWNGLRDYQYFAQNAKNIHLVYNPGEKTISCFGTVLGDTIGYIYNFELQNWTRYIKPNYSFSTSMALNDGSLLVYKTTTVDILFDDPLSGNHINYVAEISPFEADDQNIEKWFYEIRIDYVGHSPSVQYSIDESFYSENLIEVESGVFSLPENGIKKGKSIRIRLAGDAKIRSMSIIFRPKIVRS